MPGYRGAFSLNAFHLERSGFADASALVNRNSFDLRLPEKRSTLLFTNGECLVGM